MLTSFTLASSRSWRVTISFRRRIQYFYFMQAAMLTFGAYRNEVAERGSDAELFPKSTRKSEAVAKSNLLLAMEAQSDALKEGRGRHSCRPLICKSVSKNHNVRTTQKPKAIGYGTAWGGCVNDR